ncbi:hypothetical protein GCM10027290_53850 [Micromonospora sonneratiae]|uniref:Uncharacterized protein n=1 Tax=Micromonospora sonneratiae TaxID=1184706 RepID=A0ABW3YFN7_9ACTN
MVKWWQPKYNETEEPPEPPPTPPIPRPLPATNNEDQEPPGPTRLCGDMR